MKNNTYKSNKGITLIALIITIIVLLILAGITISMVTGENGVLTKAKESSLKTRKAEAKEKVGVEVLGSHDESGQINIDDLNSNLMNNLKEVQLKAKDGSYSLLTDSNKIKRLPATVKYNGFDVDIEGIAKIEIPKSADNKPDDTQTVDIGDVTVNGKQLKWQYFYKDEENVYLICSDYLPKDAIPEDTNVSVTGINVSANTRDDLINYLTNTDNWNDIKAGIEEALKTRGITTTLTVTGSPTADQFKEAFNERYGDVAKNKLEIMKDDSGQVSFKIGSDDKGYVNEQTMTAITKSKVLFPHLGSYNSCFGYWLASPYVYSEESVCDVSCYYELGSTNVTVGSGIRPVVSIPKSVFSNL